MGALPQPLVRVRDYYSGKLAQHGANARGVDWNSEESQHVRFAQLAMAMRRDDREGSVIDIGCGYGALVDFLHGGGWHGRYVGYDISEEMVDAARGTHRDCEFTTAVPTTETFDYALASGIFNVRLETQLADWEDIVVDTIELMNNVSTKAFAFNVLTSYSDADRMRPDLYYADPSRYFQLCVERYSRHVALLHDYQLYEFTIVVRK